MEASEKVKAEIMRILPTLRLHFLFRWRKAWNV